LTARRILINSFGAFPAAWCNLGLSVRIGYLLCGPQKPSLEEGDFQKPLWMLSNTLYAWNWIYRAHRVDSKRSLTTGGRGSITVDGRRFLKEDDEWPVQGSAFGGRRPLCVIRPPEMRACKLSFTARGRLFGCRAKADAETFPRMTHHGSLASANGWQFAVFDMGRKYDQTGCGAKEGMHA
jgi:hypothetical protein